MLTCSGHIWWVLSDCWWLQEAGLSHPNSPHTGFPQSSLCYTHSQCLPDSLPSKGDHASTFPVSHGLYIAKRNEARWKHVLSLQWTPATLRSPPPSSNLHIQLSTGSSWGLPWHCIGFLWDVGPCWSIRKDLSTEAYHVEKMGFCSLYIKAEEGICQARELNRLEGTSRDHLVQTLCSNRRFEQVHIQLGFEYLHGWRLYNISWQPCSSV